MKAITLLNEKVDCKKLQLKYPERIEMNGDIYIFKCDLKLINSCFKDLNKSIYFSKHYDIILDKNSVFQIGEIVVRHKENFFLNGCSLEFENYPVSFGESLKIDSDGVVKIFGSNLNLGKRELRCKKCNKLLACYNFENENCFEGGEGEKDWKAGFVVEKKQQIFFFEIKCSRCGHINKLENSLLLRKLKDKIFFISIAESNK